MCLTIEILGAVNRILNHRVIVDRLFNLRYELSTKMCIVYNYRKLTTSFDHICVPRPHCVHLDLLRKLEDSQNSNRIRRSSLLTRRLESTDAAARRRGAVYRPPGRGGSGGRAAGGDGQGAAREAHAPRPRQHPRPPRGRAHRRRVGSRAEALVAKWGYGEEKRDSIIQHSFQWVSII